MRRFLPFALIAVLAADLKVAGAAGLSDQESRAARKLYVAKCARCHKFYDPARYTDEKWGEWMDKMSRKAKLKPEQKELLSRYLDTFRGGNKTNLPASDGTNREMNRR